MNGPNIRIDETEEAVSNTEDSIEITQSEKKRNWAEKKHTEPQGPLRLQQKRNLTIVSLDFWKERKKRVELEKNQKM